MKSQRIAFKWSRADYVLATGFGAGLVPLAPGTAGTLVAIPLYWMLKSLQPGLFLAAIVLGLIVGVYVSSRVGRDLGVNDPPVVVWDEVVGYWIAMVGTPLTWQYVLVGFLLFRLLDIVKPGPINWAERKVTGGLGVMLDDALAGVLVAVILNFLPL